MRLLPVLVCSILAIVLSFAAPGSAATPSYDGQWGELGTDPGQLDTPRGVAVAPDGSVYVVDRLNYRIQKFSRDGVYQTAWGDSGSGEGQFDDAWGIAVNSSGHVFVVDTDNSRVQKFDAGGNFLLEWGEIGSGNGQFGKPWGIAVDASDNVYVTEHQLFFSTRVQKFTSAGTYVTQWGSFGLGAGQFESCRGIAVDANSNVYVVDFSLHRVQKFSSTGVLSGGWGGLGAGPGEFNSPVGVAAATDTIYITDSNDRVQMFDDNGTFLDQWGTSGVGNGQFDFPHGLAAHGLEVFVADQGNHRIQRFTYETQIGVPEENFHGSGLLRAYPNPMTSSTTIRLSLAEPASSGKGSHTVRAQVFDLAGSLVRDLFVGSLPPGEHSLTWDGADDRGDATGPGIYFVRVSVDGRGSSTTRIARLP